MNFQGLICVLLIFAIIWLLATNSSVITDTGNAVTQAPMNIVSTFDSWLNRQAGAFP